MRAIILAAGMSKRMAGKMNKCLMPISTGGETLLERKLRQFKERGIESTMVVGYQAAYVMKHCRHDASFAYNAMYDEYSSMYSLLVGAQVVHGDPVIVDFGSNVILDSVLDRLLDAPIDTVTTYTYPIKPWARNAVQRLNDNIIVETVAHTRLDGVDWLDPVAVSWPGKLSRATLDSINSMPFRHLGASWCAKGLRSLRISIRDAVEVDTLEDLDVARRMIK